MFDVNTAIQRCLAKNLAMFGLGISLYVGEDIRALFDVEETKIIADKPKTEEPVVAQDETIESVQNDIIRLGQDIVSKGIVGFETPAKIKDFSKNRVKDRESKVQWLRLRDSLTKVLNGERV
jgi:hypothetical protein